MRIAVIGGGILGASVAYHAAHAGAEVVVIDDERPGRATAAGAGIVCPWAGEHDDPARYDLLAAGAAYYPDLVAALPEQALSYGRVGALYVAAETAVLDAVAGALHARADPRAGAISRLSSAEARALFPPLHPELAAVHIGGGARVDGARMAAALLRAAGARGATLRHGLARLIVTSGRVGGVAVGAETIGVDAAVVTAGAWAPDLLRPLGIALAVTPQRGQIMHLRLPGQNTAAWPVVLPHSSHYLLAFEDARVVVGATREGGCGFDDRVTAAGQAEVLNQALAVAPGLGSATVIETRVGFRPVAADDRPMLGQVRGVAGLLIGNGLGRSGLTAGPFAGRLLAQAALGQSPALDLAPYDPCRSIGVGECRDSS